MSVIITRVDIPECCASCRCSGTDVCRKWMSMGLDFVGKKVHDDCPVKSVEGLIEFIKDHSYPVRYDRNSVEQGMTVTGIEQAIKEYCGMEE